MNVQVPLDQQLSYKIAYALIILHEEIKQNYQENNTFSSLPEHRFAPIFQHTQSKPLHHPEIAP